MFDVRRSTVFRPRLQRDSLFQPDGISYLGTVVLAEVITTSLIERNVTDDDSPLYLSRHLDAVCTIHFVSDLPGAANSP